MNNTEKGELGENFVNNIAFNSFLKYWCYPGPLDIIGDYKEICDLLIVFDSICIIVSVKNYSFKGDYQRYFKKTVDKATRQIIGAEKKLFGTKPILLKHPDREPEEFPKESIKQVYRIIVNLNPDVKYYRTSYQIEDRTITVMDAPAWAASISELNTIPDFIDYIEERCRLFSECYAFILPREELDFSTNDGQHLAAEIEELVKEKKDNEKLSIILGNELDLIATYIINDFQFPAKLKQENINVLTLKLDGEWEKFQKSKSHKIKTEFENESYFIDQIVSEMIIDKKNGEKLSKMFYKLNRFDRASFARAYLDYHAKLKTSNDKVVFDRTHIKFNDVNMVFVFFDDKYPTDMLNNFTELSLIHYGYLHNFKCGDIGLLGVSQSFSSFVFGYMDNTKQKNTAQIIKCEETFKELGWKLAQE